MNKTVLITGGFGFLGRSAAKRFKQCGYRVVGVGHGRWDSEVEAKHQGFDVWLDADISLSSLMSLRDECFDLVIHCAGNGLVSYSFSNPLEAFHKTVQSTICLLEYLRIKGSKARVVYTSSAGVYGVKGDMAIKEDDELNPISPYGYHKKITEDLLASYSLSYAIPVTIIRFFSIYGCGLTKQLLWDASQKILSSKGEVVFWGTGEETRDWINSIDASELMLMASQTSEHFCILNGACGKRITVRDVLDLLRNELDVEKVITFNGQVREGDPRFYHADVQRSLSLGWKPTVSLADGIHDYVAWLHRYRAY